MESQQVSENIQVPIINSSNLYSNFFNEREITAIENVMPGTCLSDWTLTSHPLDFDIRHAFAEIRDRHFVPFNLPLTYVCPDKYRNPKRDIVVYVFPQIAHCWWDPSELNIGLQKQLFKYFGSAPLVPYYEWRCEQMGSAREVRIDQKGYRHINYGNEPLYFDFEPSHVLGFEIVRNSESSCPWLQISVDRKISTEFNLERWGNLSIPSDNRDFITGLKERQITIEGEVLEELKRRCIPKKE